MKSRRIYFLTGNVHTGKTTILLSVCRELKAKDMKISGLLSLSRYDGGKILGYDGYDLSTEETFPLARIRSDAAGGLRCGRFFFFPEGQNKARQALLKPGNFDLTAVDEMGPLELNGQGYWQPVQELLTLDRSLMFVIRKPLLHEFTQILPLPDLIFDMSQKNIEKSIQDTILNK